MNLTNFWLFSITIIELVRLVITILKIIPEKEPPMSDDIKRLYS